MYNQKDIGHWLENLNDSLSDFLGRKNEWELENSSNGLILYINEDQYYIPYLENSYKEINDIIGKEISKYVESDFINLPSTSQLINNVVLKYLFKSKIGINLKTNLEVEKFVDTIQNIANLTYENQNINMGIILCKNKNAIEYIKKSKEFTFIEIERIKLQDLFRSEKPLLKLIDNKNFNIILDKDFYVIGVIKRKIENKYLNDIFEEQAWEYQKSLFKRDIIDELIYMIKTYYSDTFRDGYIKANKEINSESINVFTRNILNKNKTYNNNDLIKLKKNNKLLEFILDEKNKMYVNNSMNKISSKLINILENEKCKKNKKNNSIIFSDLDIMFISIKNKKSNFLTSNYVSVCCENGKWNIKNYISLAHDIFLSMHKYVNKLIEEDLN